MSTINRQFRIAARPVGMVKESDFEYAEGPIPDIRDGQARIRTTYLSLDPSMRGQMENRADYVAPLAIGDVMRAGGVGVVDASKLVDLPLGALVAGSLGMQDYNVTDGKTSRTQVKLLSADERVEELSRMLGGLEITERTRAHAAEMIDRAAR